MVVVRCFFDVHVSRTIADQLVNCGIDVLTAQSDDSAALADHEILTRATDLRRTRVTSDIRFRALAEKWQKEGRLFSGLVHAHPLQVTIGRMVVDLELIAKAVTPEEILNQVIFLLL